MFSVESLGLVNNSAVLERPGRQAIRQGKGMFEQLLSASFGGVQAQGGGYSDSGMGGISAAGEERAGSRVEPRASSVAEQRDAPDESNSQPTAKESPPTPRESNRSDQPSEALPANDSPASAGDAPRQHRGAPTEGGLQQRNGRQSNISQVQLQLHKRQQQAIPAVSVDGIEKGFSNRSSTEASVSAQKIPVPPPTQDSEDTSASPEQNPLEPLLRQQARAELAGQALPAVRVPLPVADQRQENSAPADNSHSAQSSQPDGESLSSSLKLKVQSYETAIPPRGQPARAPGLAEQFMQLLTDAGEKLEGSDAQQHLGQGDNGPAASTTMVMTRGDSQAPQQPVTENVSIGTRQMEPANIDRIVRVIRGNIGRQHGHLRVQLHPPQLGRVRLDVHLNNNRLSVSVLTETAEAAHALGDRLHQLRTALESHGVTIQRMQVQLRPSGADSDRPANSHSDSDPNGQNERFDRQQQQDQPGQQRQNNPRPRQRGFIDVDDLLPAGQSPASV